MHLWGNRIANGRDVGPRREEKLAALPAGERRAHLAAAWSRLLGDIKPAGELVGTPEAEIERKGFAVGA